MKISVIEKAAQIAVVAHKNQVRKSDDTPYIVHPFMVADKLIRYGFSDFTIAAGLVHDVIEDSDVTEADIRRDLGAEVLEIVKYVSEDKTQVWEERKKHYAERVRSAPPEAKAVCAADKIHNLESSLIAYEEQGESLWDKFNRGREQKLEAEKAVLASLKANWEHPLLVEYEELLGKMEKLK
jgi:(p)ppGpp synthase/HD superfamily hydrolase